MSQREAQLACAKALENGAPSPNNEAGVFNDAIIPRVIIPVLLLSLLACGFAEYVRLAKD